MKQVTDEELQEMQKLRETLLEVVTITGELTLSKFLAERQVNEISIEIEKQQNRFLEFQAQERVLFEQLQQKYGTGNFNIETGEITE